MKLYYYMLRRQMGGFLSEVYSKRSVRYHTPEPLNIGGLYFLEICNGGEKNQKGLFRVEKLIEEMDCE